MTQNEMNTLMKYMLEDINKMRIEGQKEYSHDSTDVFANFTRVGNLLDESRQKVLMTYMLKHIDGIAAYVKGHKSQREDVRGRITDSIVYLMLLRGMIEEDDGTVYWKEGDKDMRDVQERLKTSSGGISLEGGRISSYRVESNGNLQEMCSERTGLKEDSREAGKSP